MVAAPPTAKMPRSFDLAAACAPIDHGNRLFHGIQQFVPFQQSFSRPLQHAPFGCKGRRCRSEGVELEGIPTTVRGAYPNVCFGVESFSALMWAGNFRFGSIPPFRRAVGERPVLADIVEEVRGNQSFHALERWDPAQGWALLAARAGGRYAPTAAWSAPMGLRRARRLRFCAVAASRNSSLAPFGPLRRRRARRRIRLR